MLPLHKQLSDTEIATINVSVNSTKSTSSIRKRRMVRFAEDHETRRVRRRVIELQDEPVSSQMSDQEKSLRWRQRSDSKETSAEVKVTVKGCHNDSAKAGGEVNSYDSYSEAIAATYNSCYSNDVAIPIERMTILALPHSERRGLESIINPTLGFTRLQKRRELIRGVLSVQDELRQVAGKSQSDIADDLGMVSEYLSKPATRFARAIATADEALACFECTFTPVSKQSSSGVNSAVA